MHNTRKIQYIFFIFFICLVCKKNIEIVKISEEKLLIKDPGVENYFSINSESIIMYSSPQMKSLGIGEFQLYKDEFSEFIKLVNYSTREELIQKYLQKGMSRFKKQNDFNFQIDEHLKLSNHKQLSGWRIALDPGHIAQNFEEAIEEERYIWVTDQDGKEIKFYESENTTLTAQILKELLERDGATVFLSKDKNTNNAMGIPFSIWKDKYSKRDIEKEYKAGNLSLKEKNDLLSNSTNEKLKKFFVKNLDLETRAYKINNFRPDLTLIIHYNTHELNLIKKYSSQILKIGQILSYVNTSLETKFYGIYKILKQIHPTDKDYSIFFVPGSFSEKDMEKIHSRIEFLRLLVSKDYLESIEFSKYIKKSVEEKLQVFPTALLNDKNYIFSGEEGIYARNLRLTRLIHGPICYAEPFLQNNIQELEKLSKKDYNYKGKLIPFRIFQTALAYYTGIKNYIINNQKINL